MTTIRNRINQLKNKVQGCFGKHRYWYVFFCLLKFSFCDFFILFLGLKGVFWIDKVLKTTKLPFQIEISLFILLFCIYLCLFIKRILRVKNKIRGKIEINNEDKKGCFYYFICLLTILFYLCVLILAAYSFVKNNIIYVFLYLIAVLVGIFLLSGYLIMDNEKRGEFNNDIKSIILFLIFVTLVSPFINSDNDLIISTVLGLMSIGVIEKTIGHSRTLLLLLTIFTSFLINMIFQSVEIFPDQRHYNAGQIYELHSDAKYIGQLKSVPLDSDGYYGITEDINKIGILSTDTSTVISLDDSRDERRINLFVNPGPNKELLPSDKVLLYSENKNLKWIVIKGMLFDLELVNPLKKVSIFSYFSLYLIIKNLCIIIIVMLLYWWLNYLGDKKPFLDI